jgi:hypothetical protein
MKSSKLILALWLGTSAWAQTLSMQSQVNPPVAAKPNGARMASSTASSPKPPAPATTTTATPAARRSANGQPVNVSPRQIAAPVNPPAARPAAVKAATRSGAKSAAQSSSRRHSRKAGQPSSGTTALAAGGKGAPVANRARRDPFVSPVVDRIKNAASCSGSGKQCLVIGEISLHGVVHSPSGFIAVVMNGEHTYFLRENDPLADGSVERITKDAIILREHSSDVLGRPLTREVTKKLGAPPV